MSQTPLAIAQSAYASHDKVVRDLEAKLKVAKAARAAAAAVVVREASRAEKLKLSKLVPIPSKKAKAVASTATVAKVKKTVIGKVSKEPAVCVPCAPVKRGRGRPRLSDCNACRRRREGLPGNGHEHICGKVLWAR